MKHTEISERLDTFRKSLEVCTDIIYVGDPRLRIKCEPARKEEVLAIADTLKRNLRLYRECTGKGRGLAAPQVGIHTCVFVTYTDNDFHVFVNPVLAPVDGEQCLYRELCISCGLFSADVKRYSKINLMWHDEHGTYHEEVFGGMEARLLQHEFDHLQGIVNVDVGEKGSIEFARKDLSSEQIRPV